jgi:hypothetical protein
MALSTPRDIFRVVWSLFSKDGNGNNFQLKNFHNEGSTHRRSE